MTRAPRKACLRGALLAGGAIALTGCQFFFPTPIEGHLEQAKPASVVRAVGAPFRPGEVIKADVYLDSVVAGRGELRTGSPCKLRGQTVIPVTTSAESTGLARFLQTAKSETAGLVDLDTSFPLEARSDATIGGERGLAEVAFDKAQFDFRHQRFYEDGPKTTVDEIKLPIEQGPHDGHSALGYLRNWRPEPGTRGYLYAVYGRYPWRADLVFVGPETLHTERGDEKTVRIDGSATKLIGRSLMPSENTPSRPFTIWISDDDRRTPVRILIETSLAKITVELTSYARVDPPAGAPSSEAAKGELPSCTPLFDEKPLRAAVADRIREEKQRQAAAAELASRYPPGSDAAPHAKSHDDDQEEKDALERVLRSIPH